MTPRSGRPGPRLTDLKRTAAYLAGYFDGEGCITFHRGCLRVLVSASYPRMVQVAQAMFGGLVSPRTRKAGTKKLYQWAAYSSSAERFLEAVGPWLLEKREQAALALRLFRREPGLCQDEAVARLSAMKHESFNLSPSAAHPPERSSDAEA